MLPGIYELCNSLWEMYLQLYFCNPHFFKGGLTSLCFSNHRPISFCGIGQLLWLTVRQTAATAPFFSTCTRGGPHLQQPPHSWTMEAYHTELLIVCRWNICIGNYPFAEDIARHIHFSVHPTKLHSNFIQFLIYILNRQQKHGK